MTNLDPHPSSSNYPADLDPEEVGIVGDTGHAATGSSYHLGKSQLRADSYSIVESLRDKRGLTDAAMALDIGWFQVELAGRTHNLRTFSAWLVEQCKAGTADTADIREVIYSLDGSTVKRWDRLGRRTTGDNSHLYHSHLSYFRDSEGRDKTALFRRYLTEIGLLGDDMSWTDDVIANPTWRPDSKTNPTVQAKFALGDAWNQAHAANVAAAAANTKADRILVALGQLAGRDFTDEAAIAAAVVAGLPSADEIAKAIPEGMAAEVVELLSARMAS